MSLYSKPVYPRHGFPRNWTALDLADAIPLRLSERVSLGLVEFPSSTSANVPLVSPAVRGWRHGAYARSTALPDFRVR